MNIDYWVLIRSLLWPDEYTTDMIVFDVFVTATPAFIVLMAVLRRAIYSKRITIFELVIPLTYVLIDRKIAALGFDKSGEMTLRSFVPIILMFRGPIATVAIISSIRFGTRPRIRDSNPLDYEHIRRARASNERLRR